MPRRSSATSEPDPARSPAAQRDVQAFVAKILADAPDQPLPAPREVLEQAQAMGVAFEPGEVQRLGRYLALLLHANKAMNLTAITDPDQAWQRHVLDALTLLAPMAELPDGSRVIDVGTGGGVPGVPLAIVRPGLRFTLLDATAKKTAFVQAVVHRLGLEHAAVLTGRAERVGRDPAHRDAYDAAIARAVGPLATVAELVCPLVRPGGLALLIKGQKATEELAQAKAALHLLLCAHAGTIPTPTGQIVVLEKLRPTPKAYPRPDGEPKRRPLGVVAGR